MDTDREVLAVMRTEALDLVGPRKDLPSPGVPSVLTWQQEVVKQPWIHPTFWLSHFRQIPYLQ